MISRAAFAFRVLPWVRAEVALPPASAGHSSAPAGVPAAAGAPAGDGSAAAGCRQLGKRPPDERLLGGVNVSSAKLHATAALLR